MYFPKCIFQNVFSKIPTSRYNPSVKFRNVQYPKQRRLNGLRTVGAHLSPHRQIPVQALWIFSKMLFSNVYIPTAVNKCKLLKCTSSQIATTQACNFPFDHYKLKEQFEYHFSEWLRNRPGPCGMQLAIIRPCGIKQPEIIRPCGIKQPAIFSGPRRQESVFT